MLGRRVLCLCALGALLLGGTSAHAADVCYGANSQANQVFEVNLTNGQLGTPVAVTLPGFTVLGITAITAHPVNGTVWAVVRTAPQQAGRKLVRLDTVTGVATLVGDVPNGMSSLSFNPAGVLYAMTGQGGTPPSTLFTLDTTTAAATIVFGPVVSGPDGEVIAFGAGGVLYHSSGNSTATFSRIDLPANTVTPLGAAPGEMFGMGYSAGSGVMYGADINSQLYSINVANGARTLIGNNGQGIDVRGLAIISLGACCTTSGGCSITTQTACTSPNGWTASGACAPTNSCALQCYTARWASPTTDARAVATFDLLPPPFLLNPGTNVGTPFSDTVIKNLCITISGAAIGNGHWTGADFNSIYFYWPVAIDTTKEWVGQPQDGMSRWGFGAADPNFTFHHDFNLFGGTSTAPVGTGFYQLTPTGSTEHMRLTSFVRCEAGACCNGTTCMVSLRSVCTGTFLGPGTTCTPASSGGVNICCKADFNNSATVSVQDIFDFLAAYFAGCP